jgi:hypothetical protein
MVELLHSHLSPNRRLKGSFMKLWWVSLLISLSVMLAACSASSPQENSPEDSGQLEAQAGSWQQLGGSAGIGTGVSLAQSTTGTQWIAFEESNGSEVNIRVKFWNGTSWKNVGALSAVAGVDAWSPSLAVDGLGRPVVAWREDDRIYVQRYQKGSKRLLRENFWLNVGTGVLNGVALPNDSRIDLALNSAGNPVVAYVSGTHYLGVQRFDGTNWVFYPTGPWTVAEVGAPSLALDGSGNPVVAWSEEGFIHVQRWNGSNWLSVGTGVLSGSSDDARRGWNWSPSLALDSLGNAVVVWGCYWDICVKRFNGNTWADVGHGTFHTGVGAGRPALALDSTGNPLIAYSEFSSDSIIVERFGGNSWVKEMDADYAAHEVYDPSLSFVNDHLAIAWVLETHYESPKYIVVKRYTPN